MTPEERDTVILREVLDLIDLAIDRIPSDEASFLANLDKRDATALRVQAIGEHLGALSDAVRSLRPDLPWREAIAMRNIIAHDYGGIDYAVVFDVVANGDLAQVREAISQILAAQA